MSLAEDLRKPVPTVELRSYAPRPARRPPAEHARLVANAVQELREQRDDIDHGDTARDSVGLLERASKSVVFILNRYKQLEEHVRQLDTWSKSQVEAAEAAAERWRQAAAESERRMQEMQQQFDSVVRRAEFAERELARDRQTLSELEVRIAETFGLGSEAHDALASIEID